MNEFVNPLSGNATMAIGVLLAAHASAFLFWVASVLIGNRQAEAELKRSKKD
jgi:hypothetical protein